MVDPKTPFATEKGKTAEELQKQKADELFATLLGQMRTKSKIIFLKWPGAGAGSSSGREFVRGTERNFCG
jgi:hypothetical protein